MITHQERKLDVWSIAGKVKAEREGNTIAVQVAPQGQAAPQPQMLLLTVDMANALRDVLAQATAIPGIVVKEPTTTRTGCDCHLSLNTPCPIHGTVFKRETADV